MSPAERNALARASRGNLRSMIDQKHAANRADRDRVTVRQNRHTAAIPATAAGYAGPKNRRSKNGKGQDYWRDSPYYRTSATIDVRWSNTVTG